MSHYISLGILDLDWQAIQKDLIDYANDTVFTQAVVGFGDTFTQSWQDNLTTITQEYAKFGYNQHNTKIWKSTNNKTPLRFDWEENLLQQLPLDHAIVTLTRQDPGQILPWHYDRHFMLKKLCPEQPKQKILRILVFLEDWKTGHVIQIEDDIFSHWQRGQAISWHPDTYHLAANVGLEKKWTCNITGFLTDDNLSRRLGID